MRIGFTSLIYKADSGTRKLLEFLLQALQCLPARRQDIKKAGDRDLDEVKSEQTEEPVSQRKVARKQAQAAFSTC